MTTEHAEHEPTTFVDADLSGARFVRVDLGGAVMRAVNIDGADIALRVDERGELLDDPAVRVEADDGDLDDSILASEARRLDVDDSDLHVSADSHRVGLQLIGHVPVPAIVGLMQRHRSRSRTP